MMMTMRQCWVSLLIIGASLSSSTNGFTMMFQQQHQQSSSSRCTTTTTTTTTIRRHGANCATTMMTAAGGSVLYSSAPSDSASDEPDFSAFGYGSSSATTAKEETAVSEKALVDQVLQSLPTDLFGATVNSATQATVNELLYTLEALNPTHSPATSPLVNGVWELRYSGGYTDEFALASPTRQLALFLYSGGYSPGLFLYRLAQTLPPFVLRSESPLTITIRRDQPRVEATLSMKLLNGAIDSEVTVQAKLDAISPLRLRETYESVSIMGRTQQSLPTPLQYARDLYVTYVDDDLLVVRDASGVPEVLVRQEKRFQRNWGNEPSAVMDMGPPGDGEDAKF